MLRLKTAMVCALAASGLLAPAPEPPAPAKPARVLLVAGAATREYQFVRNLLLHEAGEGRAKLAVWLQTPPGRDAPREGVEQGATLLKKFPEEPQAYDAIVAFDPDWGQLDSDQMKQLKVWVEEGGGLVLVAGPVNTFDVARKANDDKYKSVRMLYPVVLADSRTADANDAGDKAFALHFPKEDPTTPKFLKLDPEGKGSYAGWDAFFYGVSEEHKGSVERGFYQAYPTEKLKPTAIVLATLGDPNAKLADGSEAPFLVAMVRDKGRVAYIASGEVWRLRAYREAFHDRFWTGLIGYLTEKDK
jgi:hypothetical protein